MSKLAICIGVNNVHTFIPLKGATLGAIKFSEWAHAQGYDIKLFTDENGNIVQVRPIYDFIEASLRRKTYQQIIVYFSGHGVSRGPNQEYWFLSEGGSNENEIIGLTRSADNAGTCQIPYVLFISDACRSLPNDVSQTTGGQTIFPNQKIAPKNTIDIFYATRPGAPAFEIAGDNLKDARGIFTESLISYLSGELPETIVNNYVDEDEERKRYLSKFYDPVKLAENFDYKKLKEASQKWIISAPEVDLKLKEYVEKKSFGITNGQSPEIRVKNHKMEFPLASFSDEQGKNIVLKSKKATEPQIIPALPGTFKANVLQDVKDFSIHLWDNQYDQQKITLQVEQVAEKNVFVSDQLLYDPINRIYTGIEVVGEQVLDLISPLHYLENSILRYENVNSITFPFDEPSPGPSLLLILWSGRSVPIALIKGFIAQLIFKDGYLFTINYTPAKINSYTFNQYEKKKEMIIKKRNMVSIAANNGFNYNDAFKSVDFKKSGYEDPGDFLRYGKGLDPSLGLYATYAFRENGNFDKIRSVYNYMLRDNPTVPFDVAMLAGRLEKEIPTAGFCPMMSIGWSYQHLYEEFINEDILKATKYLEPGLWTTFSPEGTKLIQEAILKNQIK